MEYKRTILHVDDDPQIIRIVACRLKKQGYEVTSLSDPSRALEELDAAHQRLVILDIDMPNVDGLELLRQIKARHAGTQVIMLTGLVAMQSLLQSFRWGAEFCIFKPMTDMKPLLEAVERTFWKIDQWWGALHHLSAEKRMADSFDGRENRSHTSAIAPRPSTKS